MEKKPWEVVWHEDGTMVNEDTPAALVVKDSNGTVLKDGDTVVLIKDLKVKGANVTLKRGSVMKNIRLTDTPDEVEGHVEKVRGLVLRTEFVKKG